jgi:hypothetical protein
MRWHGDAGTGDVGEGDRAGRGIVSSAWEIELPAVATAPVQLGRCGWRPVA